MGKIATGKIATAQRAKWAKWAKIKREKKRPDTESRAFSEQQEDKVRLKLLEFPDHIFYRLRGLLLAANCELVCRPGRGLVLVYREVYQARVVVPYLVHLGAVGRARDRERAGEEKRRQA
jgi:hypothetical protein